MVKRLSLSLAALLACTTFSAPKTQTITGPKFKEASSGQTVLQAQPNASGTVTLPSATDTLDGKNTTDVLTNETMTSDQNTYTRPETGADVFADVARWKNQPITPQDFDPTAGTGGDDSVALNKAVEAASKATGPNAGRLYLPPPPSGHYNVCADSFRPQKAANGAASLVIEGASSGGSAIRAMPGCATGAVRYATVYMDGAAYLQKVKSAFKVTFQNVRFDGSCISRYTFYNSYSVGLTFRNTVIRNAKAGNGANYYQAGGYETSMDNSNRLENVNDAGVTACYNTTADLPNYNLWTIGTDGQYGAVAVNAKIANFYGANGGNNHFIGTHAWGYPGGTDDQPNLRPQYNYLMEGNQVLLAAIMDRPTVAGLRLQNTMGDTTGAIVIGGSLIGPVESTVKGISLGSGVVSTLIFGNNLKAATLANALASDVTIDQTNQVFNNVGSNNGETWNTYTPMFSCGSGSVGATTGASGRYKIVGKTINVLASVTITTNNTCAGTARLTLPLNALANTMLAGSRFISGTGYRQTMAVIGFGTNIASMYMPDGTYPGVDGALLTFSGTYELQ